MSLELPYDPQNIFAKIIAGEIPCTKVFEDDAILSFMDLFPQSRGHALVISKNAKATNLFDIDQNDLQTLITGVQKLGKAMKQALNPDGIRLAQFNGEAAGQTVFHLHFHLIPVYDGAALGAHANGGQVDPEELKALAAQIASQL